MAAACKGTRAYSAVIDRQATLSYECVDFTKLAAAYACTHRMRWSSSSSPAVSSPCYRWRTDFLLRHSIEDPWQRFWTSTSHFELRARCSAPTKARTAALPPQPQRLKAGLGQHHDGGPTRGFAPVHRGARYRRGLARRAPLRSSNQ